MFVSRASIGLLALVAASACVGHRTLIPSIQESPRQGLSLQRPVRIAILDARPDKHDSDEVVSSLREGLSRIYGDSLVWVPYFEPTPPDEVSLRIRVLACGADFGSRLFAARTLASASSAGSTSVATPWGFVLAEASSQPALLAGDRAGPGWWIGASWLELQLEDRRFGAEALVFPIAAEDRQPNFWGYWSAHRAAKRAWFQVAQGLVRGIDVLLLAIRDLENP